MTSSSSPWKYAPSFQQKMFSMSSLAMLTIEGEFWPLCPCHCDVDTAGLFTLRSFFWEGHPLEHWTRSPLVYLRLLSPYVCLGCITPTSSIDNGYHGVDDSWGSGCPCELRLPERSRASEFDFASRSMPRNDEVTETSMHPWIGIDDCIDEFVHNFQTMAIASEFHMFPTFSWSRHQTGRRSTRLWSTAYG